MSDLTDSGSYRLTLVQSGPTSAGAATFSASGIVTFNLVLRGSLNASGFTIKSVSLTETAAIIWNLAQSNASVVLSNQTGTQNLTTTTSASAVGTVGLDPFLAVGLNWLAPSRQLIQDNALNPGTLSLTSLSIGETGQESYVFRANGLETYHGQGGLAVPSPLQSTRPAGHVLDAADTFEGSPELLEVIRCPKSLLLRRQPTARLVPGLSPVRSGRTACALPCLRPDGGSVLCLRGRLRTLFLLLETPTRGTGHIAATQPGPCSPPAARAPTTLGTAGRTRPDHRSHPASDPGLRPGLGPLPRRRPGRLLVLSLPPAVKLWYCSQPVDMRLTRKGARSRFTESSQFSGVVDIGLSSG